MTSSNPRMAWMPAASAWTIGWNWRRGVWKGGSSRAGGEDCSSCCFDIFGWVGLDVVGLGSVIHLSGCGGDSESSLVNFGQREVRHSGWIGLDILEQQHTM
jgi:hypothetical protein